MPNATLLVLESLNVPLARDVFFRDLIRELAGTLQEVVGTKQAADFSLAGRCWSPGLTRVTFTRQFGALKRKRLRKFN